MRRGCTICRIGVRILFFLYLKDKNIFSAKTGFTTADKSNPRYMYHVHKACSWNGKVWPFATSIALNAVINLLNDYNCTEITDNDLFEFTKTYAKMHYLTENGKTINFIDEVMLPDEYVWDCREFLKNREVPLENGGKERGRDYNHSTFIDIVLRGICGVGFDGNRLSVNPRIKGIWKWFKIENLSFRKKTYNIYYDEDGSFYNKGKGVIIEKV